LNQLVEKERSSETKREPKIKCDTGAEKIRRQQKSIAVESCRRRRE